jgi:alkylhydroperoxidase/carboxymuconolactone decarboxylase family protein YurZ
LCLKWITVSDVTECDDILSRGAELRRQVLGPDWVAADPTDAEDPMSHFIAATLRTTWAGTWAREGLDLRSRSIVTLTVMTALGRTDELALHIRGALRNAWLAPAEIREILLHTAPYLGFPAAQSALRTLKAVLNERAAAGESPRATVEGSPDAHR